MNKKYTELYTSIRQDYQLPTKGRLDGLKDEGNFTIRTMTVNEQKLIAGSSGMSAFKKMSGVIKKCLVDSEIDPYDLTLIDYTYLLYKLRIVSLGKDYRVTIGCPYCDSLVDTVCDLSELECITIDDLVNSKGEKVEFDELFEVTLPITGAKLGCKMLRLSEIDDIQKVVAKKLERFPDMEGDPSTVVTMSKIIKTVDGEKVPEHELENFIAHLPFRDYNYIDNIYDKVQFGLILSAEAECPKCHKKFRYALPRTDDFFRSEEPDAEWRIL